MGKVLGKRLSKLPFFWKGEGKFCSNTLCTDNIDIFIMCLQDFLDNGKAKSCTLFVLSARLVCLVKAFPDFSKT